MTKSFKTKSITRRDFMHGASLMAAGLMAGGASKGTAYAAGSSMPYPPKLTGMRGNHPGSFEVAHRMGREGNTDWGPISNRDKTDYDLVVVGAGISGLSAAFFFLQRHPNAKILILDNHDDFGGHAKRNEFDTSDGMRLAYGGSQTVQEPSKYSDEAKQLLVDLGIDVSVFDTAYDQDFWSRNGLRPGLFFNKEGWGEDRMVPINMGNFNDYLPLAESDVSVEDAIAMMPISDPAKAEMLYLMTVTEDKLHGLSEDEKYEYLYYASYRQFLEEKIGITEPEVFKVLQDLAADAGVGIEAASALSSIDYGGLPGMAATGLGGAEPFENYIHHFPDGNATIARLIVKKLIPNIAPEVTMETVALARFDYSKLDQADGNAKVRLNSTVVNVANVGDHGVDVTYVKDGKASRVRGKACIMACQHSIVPHLCPSLPEEQREALSFQERTPILYNTVLISNWRAWKNIGIGAAYMPESYHIHATLDFPVSLGEYRYPHDPDSPAIVHLERFPHVNDSGMTKREQAQAGRYELLSTSFEEIEGHIRNDLQAMLAPGGFDHERDIEAITVNRWAHGYAYSYSALFDDVYDEWDHPEHPHMIARKRFGQITFANSDSGAIALLDTAIDQAYRAVKELG